MSRQKKFKRAGVYNVYILECNNGAYYTGYTSNLDNRIREHSNTKRAAKYLRGKTPVRLVYAKEYRYLKKAMQKELEIKKLRRYQKEEIISGKRK